LSNSCFIPVSFLFQASLRTDRRSAMQAKIVAYRMAKRPVFDWVSSTLEAALSRTRCTAGLSVHSDHSGGQFKCGAVQYAAGGAKSCLPLKPYKENGLAVISS